MVCALAPARPQVYVYICLSLCIYAQTYSGCSCATTGVCVPLCPLPICVGDTPVYICRCICRYVSCIYTTGACVPVCVCVSGIRDTDRASLRVAESRCASLVFARLTTLSVPGELRSITCKHQEHHTLTTLNVLGAGPRTIAAKFAPPLSSSSCVADALATASYQQQEHHV